MQLHSKNENKEVLKKSVKLWDGIENEVETISGAKEDEYGKDFMKVEFDTNDDLPLNKLLKLSSSLFRWMFVWVIYARIW